MSDGAAAGARASTGATEMADRVFKGTLVLALSAVVTLVGQLATVSAGMKGWGAVRYGEWIWLSGLVTFLTLTDLGIQNHVVNRMNAHNARGERDRVLSELHSALRVQAPLAAGLWAAGAASLYFLLPALERRFQLTTTSRFETYLTLLFFGAELLIGVPMGAVRGTYRATQKLTRAAVITAIKRMVELALPALLMLAGARFWTIALGRLVWALLIDLYVVHDLHRQYGWFRLRPLGGDLATGLRMLPAGFLFLLAGFADYLASQGNLMVVQSALGGAEVAHFATHRTIANMGRMVAMQLTASMWPELTTLDTLGESARLTGAHRTLAKFGTFLVGAPLVAFLPMSEWVYRMWTMRALSLDTPTMLLLIAQTTLWGFWSAGWTVLMATNRQGRLVVLLALDAALAIGLSALLVPRIGMRGAALAVLVADCTIALWAVPRAACAALGDRFGAFARAVVPAIVLALVVPSAVSALAWWALPSGVLRAAVPPIVFASLALPLLWTALTPEERAIALRLGDKVRRRLAGSRARAA
ncbi:lipopolysaccharide biosynthesis protein [Polyangium aurulentum]|uniref:lipopolysaccharide biosynthesis protein n=1 Tax=Polyangium aurulentum TaxID=2567896 RepID=UPI0010AEAA05|nr:lipopolysaccharide biosynthesis protein [Polyangium aurulentum]UQA62388.1 lipopolysaccharide biosynthesis protein [Polyangium aurulentum]